jgi:uncharacterized membrane protein AbrB (regulator of aidB expression)
MDLQTLRKPKILGMSIFDWTVSLLLGLLVGWLLSVKGLKWIPFLVAWILFGIAVHAAFGVNTMLGYYLGLNPKPVR